MESYLADIVAKKGETKTEPKPTMVSEQGYVTLPCLPYKPPAWAFFSFFLGSLETSNVGGIAGLQLVVSSL